MKKILKAFLFLICIVLVFVVSCVLSYNAFNKKGENAPDPTPVQSESPTGEIKLDMVITDNTLLTIVTPGLNTRDSVIRQGTKDEIVLDTGKYLSDDVIDVSMLDNASVPKADSQVGEAQVKVEESAPESKKETEKTQETKTEEAKTDKTTTAKTEEKTETVKKEETKTEKAQETEKKTEEQSKSEADTRVEEKVEEEKNETKAEEKAEENLPVQLDPNKQYSDTGL